MISQYVRMSRMFRCCVQITNFNSVGANVRGVFGAKLWPFNFLVPLHWLYPPVDNAVDWPNIKA